MMRVRLMLSVLIVVGFVIAFVLGQSNAGIAPKNEQQANGLIQRVKDLESETTKLKMQEVELGNYGFPSLRKEPINEKSPKQKFEVKFIMAFKEKPRVHVSLTNFDLQGKPTPGRVAITISVVDVTKDGFTVQLESWDKNEILGASMSYVAWGAR
jgi:hypothetical protein